MNADAFRHFYNYHFAMNRFIWDSYIVPLIDEQFTRPAAYSHGSVRDQLVHMMNADDLWFKELRGLVDFELPEPDDFEDREHLRAHWDEVEKEMRAHLASLQDDMLFAKPIAFEEDKDLIQWQVLLHVVNHGTDHRAQILRQLNDLGAKTISQDYIFYIFEHL